MMESLRQLMIFIRYLGLVVANKSGLKKKTQIQLLKEYIVIKILNIFPKSVKNNIKQLWFLGCSLDIFDLKTTTALIEAIFIENEYYFKTKNNKPVIIDLGSNIGLSVIYSKMQYPNCKINAFEADPTTCEVLKKNVDNFNFKGIKINNLAVTNKSGTVDFFVDKAGPGSPLMSTNPLRVDHKTKISVTSIKLSGVINDKVDFLKMDIEGAEVGVLTDLDKSQKIKLIDQMSIEYHHHIDNNLDELSGFLKILEKNNFGYQIHASQNTPFTLKTFEDIQIHAYKKN